MSCSWAAHQFTSKLESMFNDINTSRDMMAEYKGSCAASSAAASEAASSSATPHSDGDIDLSVQVRLLLCLLLPFKLAVAADVVMLQQERRSASCAKFAAEVTTIL